MLDDFNNVNNENTGHDRLDLYANACRVHLHLRDFYFVAVLVKMHCLSYITLYMTNFFSKKIGRKKSSRSLPIDRELFWVLPIFAHTFVHVFVNGKQCQYVYLRVREREIPFY